MNGVEAVEDFLARDVGALAPFVAGSYVQCTAVMAPLAAFTTFVHVTKHTPRSRTSRQAPGGRASSAGLP